MRRNLAIAGRAISALSCLLACLLALTACTQAGGWRRDGIALPRKHASGAPMLLEVRLGVVGSGQEIVLRTYDGQLVGTVSPHGIRTGKAAGTYLVPIPARVRAGLRDRHRLQLRAWIERAGAEPREADADEVLDIRAVSPVP